MDIERKIAWVLLAVSFTAPACVQAAQVTVDYLMRLSTVSDVRISPDGKEVAYVVTTPSLETASHEAVLYRIPAAGGTPLRLTYTTRIFNKPLPSPWLRWSADGSLLSFVAYVGDVPQVMAMSPKGGEPWALTSLKEGVTRYEWSPDGKQIAFIASDPPPPEDEQRKKNKSFVIHVDKGKRPPRLWLQAIPGGAPQAMSPADKTVLDFHWAPDGKSLVYAGSDETGFQAPYNSGIYTISTGRGEP
jgi:Tol biopolymer transport system component